ncbi:hypothetical protein FJ444_20825 [Aestuariibacter sp. GS-14]|uniref:hypothetical protein n=1 Tax=Aestuariibacter sp. GS-14 TaxID=2590670 RepID=UPI00112B9F51|nr:hypothetical protein [Aestuariibacter sp. GS-14]TPV52896.1 hypothetical protein FJ444_20825 [Aestuariibacter sp. GS-14]
MPKKLSFTNCDLDIKFLFRFTERLRQRDESLGFDSYTFERIEMFFPHDVFIKHSYDTVIQLANDKLLKILDAEQRQKLSKARYAFKQKRKSSSGIKLDATRPTSWFLKEITEILKEELENDDSIDKSLLTQKRVLEASLTTLKGLIRSYSLPGKYQGFEEYVINKIITNLKESDY